MGDHIVKSFSGAICDGGWVQAGGVSALGGVSMYPLPTLDNGEIPLEAMEEAHR